MYGTNLLLKGVRSIKNNPTELREEVDQTFWLSRVKKTVYPGQGGAVCKNLPAIRTAIYTAVYSSDDDSLEVCSNLLFHIEIGLSLLI